MGSDAGGPTLDPLDPSFDVALVCLEPDVLGSAIRCLAGGYEGKPSPVCPTMDGYGS